jgi:hypothetical protein
VISIWKTAALGLAFTASGMVAGGTPEQAAAASDTPRAVTVAAREFVGLGGSSHRAQAIAIARADAFGQAAAAGASRCSVTHTDVDDTDPFLFIAEVTVTCKN